jgi:ATP-dependent RNA helicase DDX27
VTRLVSVVTTSLVLIPLPRIALTLQPKRGKYEGLSRKQTRRKIAREMDEADGSMKTAAAGARAAKKAARPVKITEAQPKKVDAKSKRRKTEKSMKKMALGKGGFDTDSSKRGGKAVREGMRAGRSDGVGLGGKKKSGGGAKGKPKGKGRK